MIRKILCFFGLHRWTDIGVAMGFVRCEHCGKKDFEFIP
jgi:hypothetical protein